MRILCIAKNNSQFEFFEKYANSHGRNEEIKILPYYDVSSDLRFSLPMPLPRRGMSLDGFSNVSEKGLPKEISKYIFADREIRHFNYRRRNNKNMSRNVWGYVHELHAELEAAIELFKPQVVLSEFVTGLADSLICEISKNRKIPFVSIRQGKLEAGLVFCLYNHDMPFPSLSEALKFETSNHSDLVKIAAENHIDKIRASYETPSYMEKTKSNIRFEFAKLRLLMSRVKRSLRYKNLDELKDSVHWYFVKVYNAARYRAGWFDSIETLKDNAYFVYPLHYEPEQSVDIRGFPHSQFELIEKISKFLPEGRVLAVKEHRGNLGYRNGSDYRRILSLPNVILVDRNADNKELLKGSLGVLTMSGRMGWEASCSMIPVFVFGDCFYSRLYNEFDGRCDRLVSFLNYPDDAIAGEKDVFDLACDYISATKLGSFVLNSDQFLSDRNIADFHNAFSEYMMADNAQS